MVDPLSEVARQLTALVELGRVDDATAVAALAEQAAWRDGYLRETALQLQRDPDVTPRTVALLYRAAEQVTAHRRERERDQ